MDFDHDLAKRLAGLAELAAKYGPPPTLPSATDAREAHVLYQSMGTVELLDLRAAFLADWSESAKPETIAFVAGRLALIAAVLKARGMTGDGTTLVIRMRYRLVGGHVHCRLFTATAVDRTFEKSGELVFRAGPEWDDVRDLLAAAVEFVPEEQ